MKLSDDDAVFSGTLKSFLDVAAMLGMLAAAEKPGTLRIPVTTGDDPAADPNPRLLRVRLSDGPLLARRLGDDLVVKGDRSAILGLARLFDFKPGSPIGEERDLSDGHWCDVDPQSLRIRTRLI